MPIARDKFHSRLSAPEMSSNDLKRTLGGVTADGSSLDSTKSGGTLRRHSTKLRNGVFSTCAELGAAKTTDLCVRQVGADPSAIRCPRSSESRDPSARTRELVEALL